MAPHPRNSLQSLKRRGRICLAAATFLLLATPAAQVAAQQVRVADVEATMAQAEAALAKAAEMGHAWSVTRALLDEASTQLASGEPEAAMENARRALLTADQAVEQAERERDAWRARVPGA